MKSPRGQPEFQIEIGLLLGGDLGPQSSSRGFKFFHGNLRRPKENMKSNQLTTYIKITLYNRYFEL